ncbi:MAG: CPXCG motif-containing cysteine-rich protein [Chloroherpetonaceae bacterium]
MLIESGYMCAVCGEWNETTVDTEGGARQTYTEDCAVCCHPNTLYITIDEAQETAYIEARFEE